MQHAARNVHRAVFSALTREEAGGNQGVIHLGIAGYNSIEWLGVCTGSRRSKGLDGDLHFVYEVSVHFCVGFVEALPIYTSDVDAVSSSRKYRSWLYVCTFHVYGHVRIYSCAYVFMCECMHV